jgi:selenocysteine lyase/cysteine desulfurase
MPKATTKVNYDSSVTGPAKDRALAQINALLQPYKDNGVVSQAPNWEATSSEDVRTAVRTWEDSKSAETFVNQINTWLTANPTPYASQFTMTVE